MSTLPIVRATGFSLTDLERDPDQRTVTLTMLSRLHDLLGMSVDEMLLSDRAAKGLAEQFTIDMLTGLATHPNRQPRPPPGHDPDAIDDIDAAIHARTLLAVLVSRDGIGVDVLLAATRWSIAEFEAALTYLRAQLDRTALQVVATDIVLHLALRPGVLPGPLRAALARPTAMRPGRGHRDPVAAIGAQGDPAPGPGRADPAALGGQPPQRHRHPLASRCRNSGGRGTKPGDELALTFDDYDGINDPEQAVAGLLIHPDVMFGLGLSERPARRRTTPKIVP